MKCPKCKTPLRKGSKFCPKCGAKVKHTARNIFLIVLAVALLLGGAGVASWKLGLFQSMSSDNDENFVLLSGAFTDRLIVDQASALAAIGNVADILGIEDVNAEFSECKVDTVSGNTYYRFYQEYGGIPVYGRSIIVAADGYGNSLTLSGNYLNVRNIETTPQIDENSALEYTKLHYGENINVSNGGLKIYSLNNMSPELVWTMYINSDTINESCFISAKGGNVIAQISLSYTDDISHKGVDVDGETLNFNTTTLGALYSLEDEERNIHVYNAGNETLLFELLNSGGLYGLKLYTHPIGSDEKILTPVAISQFGNWEDAYAITSMGRTAMVYDFYDLVLNHIGFANSNAPIYVAYNDYFDGVVEQAMSSWFKLEDGSSAPVTLLHFGSETSLSIDLIAHEYTHSVEHAISSMVYLGESGALMESYSDILGECIEDWSYLIDNNGEKRYDTNHLMDDSCDWLHNGGTRDLVNPENSIEGDFTPHPRIYQGSNWVDTSDSFDYGGVHINSTVISHAAYLMNTGIGGNPNYQALSTEDLAHLFYETLYTLPSDCTFSQFRTLVENTADIMCQQGALTEKQRLCVSNAFFQVGIAPTTTPVAKELTLDIYGADGLPYEDYTLYVRHYSGAEKTYTSETIMKEGISFPAIGSYELCIIDNANTDNHTSIYVNVLEKGGVSELPIYTECGLASIDISITATPSSEPGQGDSAVPTFLSFHPFEDNKSQFQLLTYEITGGLSETDGKYGTYTNQPNYPFVASLTDDFTHDGQMSSLSIDMEEAKGGLDKHLAIHVVSSSGGSHNYLLTSLGNDWDGESVYYYLFKGSDSDYLVEEHLTPFSSSYDETNYYFGKEDGNRTEFIRIVSLTDFSEMKYEFATNMGSGGYIITERIKPAEGSSSYSTLFSHDGEHYHYGNEAIYASLEEAMAYINAKLSEIGLTNRIGWASGISESNVIPLFVLHREGIHDTVALSSAGTLELKDTMYFGVNPDLSSGTIETTSEGSQASTIFGVWDSIDGGQRMIFTSKGTFAVSYESGIQDADGTVTIIDLEKGKRNAGGFTVNGNSIVLTIDMQQESLNYSLNGDSLEIGDINFLRVKKALVNQLVGTWESENGKFAFDEEGNVTVTRGSNYDRGVYAILSEFEIMLNIDNNGAAIYSYSVTGKTFTLGNQQYIKDGDSSDYNEVVETTETLVGTWKSDTMGDYYVFRSDGVYEYYSLEILYQIGQVTTEGLYDIISTSAIKVYQDMSGGFYSEFTLSDGVLTSSSYSSSAGGYIQYRKVE